MAGSLLLASPASADGGGFWLPVRGSHEASAVDSLFHFILWISVVFFALIVLLMVLFILRYRRRVGAEAGASPSHNLALEITWTVIPLILVVIIFAIGFKTFLGMSVPPANAYEIQATGQKWKWLFTYPNGHVDEDLHVPVDRPVQLVLTSEDVIHSLFIPDFRVKRDAVPGRFTKTWFTAARPGQHDLFCAEYCGTGHSDMLAKVVVHAPGEFEKWLRDAGDFLDTLPPAAAGERLFRTRGCKQCHSVDGAAGIGPTFQGLFGHPVVLVGGKRIEAADENYLRESILEPQARIVAGFEPVMPTYKGRLSDKEIQAIIAYIKSLTP